MARECRVSEDGRGEGAAAAWALTSLALLFGVLLEGRRGLPGPKGPPTITPSLLPAPRPISLQSCRYPLHPVTLRSARLLPHRPHAGFL